MTLLLGAGTSVAALGGMAWAVWWYPQPDPRGYPYNESPEQYVLPPLFLCMALLVMGTYLLTVQVYWLHVVRKAWRSAQTT